MSATRGNKRLARLLKLIPFLQKNPGISVSQTAILFEVSEKELISDLNLIWLCGLPGYSHLELMDISYDSGFISISNADTLARPMRMTFDEGSALFLAITKLSEITSATDSKTLIHLRDKLAKLLSIDLRDEREPFTQQQESLILPELQQAIKEEGRFLDITYYSATLDDVQNFLIKPLEIQSLQGYLYLLASSIENGNYKYFRIDRIMSARARRLSDEIFSKTSEYSKENSIEASMEVAKEGFWFIQKWRLPNFQFDPTRNLFAGTVLVYNPKWIERAALSAGGLVGVVSPPELRQEVAAAASRTLERYADRLK